MEKQIEVVTKIEMRKLNEIKPYFRNPRKNDRTVEQLVKIIPLVGFNVPILVDKNGVIVKGHARYKAAFKLGLKEVPVVVTEADEEAIKLDRISDNKISEFSEWTKEALEHELDLLDIGLNDILVDLNLKDKIKTTEDTPFEETYEFEDGISVLDENEMEKQIQKAELKQVERQQQVKQKYIKCMCHKCGEVFYIPIDKVVFEER